MSQQKGDGALAHYLEIRNPSGGSSWDHRIVWVGRDLKRVQPSWNEQGRIFLPLMLSLMPEIKLLLHLDVVLFLITRSQAE